MRSSRQYDQHGKTSANKSGYEPHRTKIVHCTVHCAGFLLSFTLPITENTTTDGLLGVIPFFNKSFSYSGAYGSISCRCADWLVRSRLPTQATLSTSIRCGSTSPKLSRCNVRKKIPVVAAHLLFQLFYAQIGQAMALRGGLVRSRLAMWVIWSTSTRDSDGDLQQWRCIILSYAAHNVDMYQGR